MGKLQSKFCQDAPYSNHLPYRTSSIKLKVAIVGEAKVGKTTIFEQYCQGSPYQSIKQKNYHSLRWSLRIERMERSGKYLYFLSSDKHIQVELLDKSSEERYRNDFREDSLMLSEADGAILVYSNSS
jgi:GTPase SAR1 family protein